MLLGGMLNVTYCASREPLHKYRFGGNESTTHQGLPLLAALCSPPHPLITPPGCSSPQAPELALLRLNGSLGFRV